MARIANGRPSQGGPGSRSSRGVAVVGAFRRQCALDQIKLAACMYKLNSTVVFGGGVCGAGAGQMALGRSAVPGGQSEHHWLGLGAAVRVLIYIHIVSHTYTR